MDPRIARMTPEEVLRAEGTTSGGLAPGEAAARLARYGPNLLPAAPRRSHLLAFADQLFHFMALLLWAGGALAFVARMPELGVAIWTVIWLNAIFSFWQEFRAERALARIVDLLPSDAKVIRGGRAHLVPASELVPGDLVELAEGDRVSADARLVEAHGLALDQSILTGESVPVPKEATPLSEVVAADLQAAELPDVVLAGATVAVGRARAVVVATGTATELGQLARVTAGVKREKSTLELEVARIVRIMTFIAVGMGILVFVLTLAFVGLDTREAFLFAIGIIVANVPEGLLPTVTLALAMGVQRMAKQSALVRRLSAIETLSATTVICTDKTGTLTTNQMALQKLWAGGAWMELDGSGALREAARSSAEAGDGARPPSTAALRPELARLALELLENAALCSNTAVAADRSAHHRGRRAGDPTELAILDAAPKLDVHVDRARRAHPRVREVPFDSHRRRMTVAVEDGREHRVITKGSPVEVIASCAGVVSLSSRTHEVLDQEHTHELAEALQAAEALAREGYRVLAVAERRRAGDVTSAPPERLEADLFLIGLLGIIDPPRPEVAAAVARCHEAGVRVVMVTGDHELTARAIGAKVGLCSTAVRVVSGPEVAALDDTALQAVVRDAPELVFARVLPEQKLRIVEAYKALGHVVAVTGDGVNDAPALRAAHVGFAMGASGTDVARQAADVVLLDDDFATIASAIEEGRAIYANIRKFLTYILSSNIPEIVPFLAMVGLRIPPALTVLQVLAVDLGTDMVPALALGAEPPEPRSMRVPPRRLAGRLLDVSVLVRAYVYLGALEAAAAMGGYFWVFRQAGISLEGLRALAPSLLAHAATPELQALQARATTVALLAIVACQIGNVLGCRSEQVPALRLPFRESSLLVVAIVSEVAIVAALVVVPPLARTFGTAPIALGDLLYLAAWPALMLAADRAWKWARTAVDKRGVRFRHVHAQRAA